MANVKTEISPAALSIPDAARYIAVSRSTMCRLIAEQTVSIIKIGQRTVVLVAVLDAYLASLSPAPSLGGAA